MATDIKAYYYSQMQFGIQGIKNGEVVPDYETQFDSEAALEKSKQIAYLIITETDMQNNKYTITDSLKTLEQSFMDDIELSEKDRNSLLRQSSISRYSIALWDYMYNDPNSEFLTNTFDVDVDDYPKPRIQDWIIGFIGISVELSPVQACVTAGVDGVVGVATGNVYAAAASSLVTAAVLSIFDIF